MAITLKPNERTSYDRKYGKYTLTRVYIIRDCTPERSIGLQYGDGVAVDKPPADNTIPGNVQIEHMSELCGDNGGAYDDATPGTDAETVTCYAIDRSATRVSEAGGILRTDITVIYVGWVMQPQFWEQGIGTISETIVASLDATPAGIGPNLEGTSVHRPRVQMTIYENLTGLTLLNGGRREVIHELTGTVNENNWDPEVTELNLAYPQGSWIYLGANITSQPGGAYNVLHRFEMTPQYGVISGYVPQQTYQSRDYGEFGSTIDIDGVSTEVRRRVWSDTIDRKIYFIAGTDTVHQFADLGL